MAQLTLTRQENDFLREILLCSIRSLKVEIDVDRGLVETCTADMKSAYEYMLNEDVRRITDAELLYNKLLDIFE